MNQELLKTIHFSMEIVYPPVTNLDKMMLTDIYANISKRHDYSTFNWLGNGAQLMENSGSICRILNDRIQFQEENMQADIQVYKEKSMDIISIVKEKVNIPTYVFQVVTLRALWACDPGNNAADFIMQHFLKMDPEELAILQRPLAGVGIRMNLPTPQEIFDFRIEPWFRDINNLFVELRGEYPGTFQDVETPAKRIDSTYQFLFNKISQFIINKQAI